MRASKKLVVANWKMATCEGAMASFFSNLVLCSYSHLVVCPPFVYLSSVRDCIRSYALDVGLGVQNCAYEDGGAHTGEVSAGMLADVGCCYVILGHSERRVLYDEGAAMIKRKISCALRAGLYPIICVGESKESKESGATVQEVLKQLGELGLDGVAEFVVAYEPLWAIGSGIYPKSQEIENVALAVKQEYSQASVIYGGSVSEGNASAILAIDIIDGVLVGAASLNVVKLNRILASSAA